MEKLEISKTAQNIIVITCKNMVKIYPKNIFTSLEISWKYLPACIIFGVKIKNEIYYENWQ